MVIASLNCSQKCVLLCLLPSVASTTSGQTGRSPSIPKRVSYLEHPAWTSPSVVRFYFRNFPRTVKQDLSETQLSVTWPPAKLPVGPYAKWSTFAPDFPHWASPCPQWLPSAPFTSGEMKSVPVNTVLRVFRDGLTLSVQCLQAFPPQPSILPFIPKKDFFQRWKE